MQTASAAGQTEDETAPVVRAPGRLGLPREAWQGAPLFAAAGACLFLSVVVLLQLVTGWELVNLVCLLAGASFSFLAEVLQRQLRGG